MPATLFGYRTSETTSESFSIGVITGSSTSADICDVQSEYPQGPAVGAAVMSLQPHPENESTEDMIARMRRLERDEWRRLDEESPLTEDILAALAAEPSTEAMDEDEWQP